MCNIDLSKEQQDILERIFRNDISIISGIANTGKTTIAVKLAQKLAENLNETEKPILFLCYKNEIANNLRLIYRSQKIYFSSFYNLLNILGGKNKITDNNLESIIKRKFNYNNIIIDEGQYFANKESGYNDNLIRLILNKIMSENGRFYFFYDPWQLQRESYLINYICKKVNNNGIHSLESYYKIEKGVYECYKAIHCETYNQYSQDNDIVKPKIYFSNDFPNPWELIKSIIAKESSDVEILSLENDERNSIILNYVKMNANGELMDDIRFSTYDKYNGLKASTIILIDVDYNTFESDIGRINFYIGTSRAIKNLHIIANVTKEECLKITSKIDSSDNNPYKKLANSICCDLVDNI